MLLHACVGLAAALSRSPSLLTSLLTSISALTAQNRPIPWVHVPPSTQAPLASAVEGIERHVSVESCRPVLLGSEYCSRPCVWQVLTLQEGEAWFRACFVKDLGFTLKSRERSCFIFGKPVNSVDFLVLFVVVQIVVTVSVCGRTQILCINVLL